MLHHRFGLSVTCAILSVSMYAQAAAVPPVPENPLPAQTVFGFNPKTRCPDLRITDDGAAAVVVFWIPSSGIPSHIAIKSSSGSEALDAATLSCVSRLRFAAATAPGNADPVEAWQQIAFGWAHRAAGPAPVAPAVVAAQAKSEVSGDQAADVTVHVCVDGAGKLTQDPTIVRSSGVAALDRAAVRIAASGSAYYRPDTAPNGPTASGCAQLTINFDVK